MVTRMFKHFLLALLSRFTLILLAHAQNQTGFISLDCGLPENSNYTESTTGINYISDASFIETGVSMNVSSVFKTKSLEEEYYYVRSFLEGVRNCYTISLTSNTTRYLIRGSFLYGNYDAKRKPPGFDLHVDANKWDSVNITDESSISHYEIIHVPKFDYIEVCLVNTGHGIPFISALEIRPLKNNIYVTENGSLSTFLRLDFGTLLANQTYRYKDDVFDRIWYPALPRTDWTSISTSLTVGALVQSDYQLPSVVMSTASIPRNTSAPTMGFSWVPPDNTSQYYVNMYFAEIKDRQANQSRIFNIYLNGFLMAGPIVPLYLIPTEAVTTSALYGGIYDINLYKIENSTLPPLINAIEVYTVVDLVNSQTEQGDVDAIKKIKSIYGVTRNWQGDPCAPTAFVWDGLNCTLNAQGIHRITSLNLSSSGLAGQIAPDIFTLTMIQYLDLSNNTLTGPVPEFLSNLQSLRVLNLERNNLSGSIPANLLEKSKSGSLFLSVGENPNLCSSISCTMEKQKKKNAIVPIVASVCVFCILLLNAAAICWIIKKVNRREAMTKTMFTNQDVTVDVASNSQNGQLESKNRQFTYVDIQMITNNFNTLLGEGGFGKVYHGRVDGNSVAVKMISQSAVQRYQQFQSEVEPLIRVHHRNLTTLVGYCNERPNLSLIYEYMANGDLHSHISEKNLNILSWEGRIRIALDSAQGLEYLHDDCNPPIIHRDVKPSNILVNEKFQAKLADFGLSRVIPADGVSYVSTAVAGTPGYLDPEYCTSNKLTPKSDVYSFGVVIQNLITGRPAIVRSTEKPHVTQWVSSMITKGDIRSIVDPRLPNGDFDFHSAWKAVEVSMACVSESSDDRPNMSQVVNELKECLATELAQRKEDGVTESSQIFTVNVTTETSPFER